MSAARDFVADACLRPPGTLTRIGAALARLAVPLRPLAVLVPVAGLAWLAVGNAQLFPAWGQAALIAAAIAFAIASISVLGSGLGLVWISCLLFSLPGALVMLFEPVHWVLAAAWSLLLALQGVAVVGLVLAGFRAGLRQTALPVLALLLAAAAPWLAQRSLNWIKVVPTQPSAAEIQEEIAGHEAVIAAAEAVAVERGAQRRFAEEDAEDSWNLEGMSEADAAAFLAQQEQAQLARQRLKALRKEQPAHRQRQEQRDAGASDTDSDGPDYAALGEEVAEAQDERLNDAFTYTHHQSGVAQRNGWLTLISARLVSSFVVFLAVVQWLRQLNWTFAALTPLPLSGRWLDGLQRRERRVWLRTGDAAVLAEFLRQAVAKGEGFLCCADAAPLSGVGRLRRWLPDRLFPRAGLSHLVEGDAGFVADSDFLIDGAWHDRLCATVLDPTLCRALVLDLANELDRRIAAGACSRRTINVVWACAEPLPLGLAARLAHAVVSTGWRLVIASPQAPPAELADQFDAVYGPEFFTAR